MWKEIKNALYSFLALYLLSCFIAFVITGGVLLGLLFLPIAFIAMIFLVIKEVIKWKRKPARRIIPVRDSFDERGYSPIRPLEAMAGIKEWIDGVKLRWSYFSHKDKFTFNH